MAYKKKLIEVALPLEAINAESAREKSIRHGHPSTLHLWWARRPLATARAVIWASLVDDPSSHPEQFPTEEEQRKERQRLFDILSRLVVWENSNDPRILAEARAEIMKSTDNNPPALLDPFAGGGAIPLEAQRLGLEAHAHDLNPVAVMIEKAMIEIPPKFAGQAPINPDVRSGQVGTTGKGVWVGASGLSEDVRYYGEWMKKKAFEKIGHMYPKIKVPQMQGSGEATVVAWIWTRTVKCPNPSCGCTMPLAGSFVLSKKKGKQAYIVPSYDSERNRMFYSVRIDEDTPPETGKTSRGAKFRCLVCGETVVEEYIKDCGKNNRLGSQLMAIVAEGESGKLFISPNTEHENAACVEKPDNIPTAQLPYDPRNIWCVNYGLDTYDKLFTNRQLHALSTFSSIVKEAQQQAEKDAVRAGLYDDHIPLSEGGIGARAYAEAIGVFLAFAIDREADICSSISSWINTISAIRNTFARQAIPMSWDFAEVNPFSSSAGCMDNMLNWICLSLNNMPCGRTGHAKQFDAQSDCGLRNIMVSTDPPYYDNISYADLSDYFYVWMRQTLKETYPNLFRTMLVPKGEELIATPYRHEGSSDKAKQYFEDGMYSTCCQLYQYATDSVPVSIYYAFKQSDTDSDNNVTSSGWETMLSAIIKAGFAITGTWPMRTERGVRTIAQGTNALASSIVLVCRKRDEDARSITRREFINILHREMKPALEKLQSANIAPVDLAQSAIGPGIGVFSRYKSVLEADGKPMTVRSALQIINQELDAFYNEQEGEMDSGSRFCVDLFQQYAFNEIAFGEAQVLATAKNTSLQSLAERHVLQASKGRVRLLTRDEIPESISSGEECIWLLTQQLARRLEKDGIKGCATALVEMFGSNAENAKALAYRLYTICERKGWAQEGYAYNNLVVAWPEIISMAASIKAETPEQITLDDVIKQMSPNE